MGLAIILIACPWWPSSLSFLLGLITGSGLSETAYLIVGNVMVPGFQLLFTAALTEIKFKKKERIILIIVAAFNVVFEILLFYFAFDTTLRRSQLGELQVPSIVDVEFRGMLQIYLLATIIYILLVGIFIARESLQSEDKEINLKGKFLLIGFICFAIGALMDGILPSSTLTVTLSRIVLIIGSLSFYFGFILPEWLKNQIIK
ncbi:MAG: conserved membrane protein of unknown function [Promethearchaeota archaeon]|nr:MAG: conserved membrane protein of unknown function [Candidatus Lokiarchaeota archaeon]